MNERLPLLMGDTQLIMFTSIFWLAMTGCFVVLRHNGKSSQLLLQISRQQEIVIVFKCASTCIYSPDSLPLPSLETKVLLL